ncbi:hypothetical protein ACVWXQ_002819 [Bradyrhizobium sp. S3.14.4]
MSLPSDFKNRIQIVACPSCMRAHRHVIAGVLITEVLAQRNAGRRMAEGGREHVSRRQ